MRSYLDQYAKQNGIAEPAPAAPPPVPEKKGFVDSVLSFFSGNKPAPAPTPAPRKSAIDQYAESNNFQAPVTPEQTKKAGQAAFLDTTPPPIRTLGVESIKLSTSTPSTVPPKPKVTLPTQAQLDNPAIAKAYTEAVEANKPPSLVKTLKNGWDSYSEGLARTSRNIAIGEISTVQSMLDFATFLGDNPKTLAHKIGFNKVTKEGADNLQKWIDAASEMNGDPTFTDQLTQGIGSSAVFFVPGLGIARGSTMLASVSPKLALLFGGSVSSALEAMSESGNTYRAVLTEKQNFVKNNSDVKIDPTTMQQDAAEAATKDFWANLILITLTNRFGAFNPNTSGFIRRMVFSSPLEGVQEAGQQIIQNASMGREDLLEGSGESFLIGAIVGGIMGSGVEAVMGDVSAGPDNALVARVPSEKGPEVAPQDEIPAPIGAQATPGEAIAPEAVQEPSPTEKIAPVASNETTVPGEKVAQEVQDLGTDGGFSSYTLDQIKENNYKLDTIKVSEVLAKDPDVKDYIDNGELRSTENGNLSAPIVIGRDGAVIDGYNRLLQHVKDGTQDITAYVAEPKKLPDVSRTLELKPEDLQKEISVGTQRNITRGAGTSSAIPEIAAKNAKEEVRTKVTLNGKTFDRPEQLVTKSQVRDILKAAGTDSLDFTVEENADGEKFMTNSTERSDTKIRPSALGLVDSELNVGDTVRITAENLKGKGTGLRAHGSGGALAFNIKNLEDGVLDSKKGEAEVDKIIKRSEIATDLAKKLGVPVRSGHFKEQALGIFKPWSHVIRLKSKLGDIRIPVLVHESGHFLDYTLLGEPKTTPKGKSWITEKFVSDMIPRAELDPLLSEYGGTPNSKKREAFAEFVRYWVTEPAKAASKAPKFLDIWENKILPDFPEVRETLETTRNDWERWNKMPAVAKVVSQISFGERGKSFSDLKDAIVHTWHDTLSKWTDDLYPIKRFSDLAKEKGVEFDIEKDPYILARLTRGWLGKASVFLEKGTFDVRFWKEVNGKAEPSFTGKGFGEILAPAVRKGATEDLAAYLVSRRAVDLNERGIHSGVNTQTAKEVLDELNKKHSDFAGIAAELDAYQNSLLDYLYHSGLLTQESHNKMRVLMKDYVPFFRVMEEAETKGLSGKTLADIRSPIKKIKGSDRDIINPLESIVKNTYALINAAERNRVGISLVNLSTKHPELNQLFEKVPEEKTKVASVKINDLIDQVSGGGFFGAEGENAKEMLGDMGEQMVNIFRPSFFHDENILTVMIDGKPQSFYTDPDMYKALHASDVEDIGIVWKLLSYPARWLRAGATLTPEFMVRNPARDMMSAFVYSDYGFMPPVDMARGLYGTFAKDNDYWLWRMGGGEQAMLVSMDRTTLKKTYEELAAEHNLTAKSTLMKGLHYAVNPLETLRLFSEFSEKMTRLGEAKKAIARGANPLEAAFSSREVTLDFAKIGSKARAVNMIVAFFNAQIQGSVRMVRAFKEKPFRTTTKTMLGITLPSILLALWNAQEPDWPEIPQWQKNLFWMVKVGDTWIRFPKPFELGIIFGSIPERIIESIQYNDPNVFPELRKSIIDGASPSFLPTSILPVIENITNYSFFLDRNLVPDSAEGLPAFAQYTSYTSETAKHIGKWLSYSPAKIDNLISGYFAGLGRYATQMIDKFSEIVAGKDAEPVAPAPEAADLPLIKAFVVRDPVTSSSESVNRFYIKAEEALAAKNYHSDLIKKQDTKAAEEWYADHGAEISLSGYYEKTRANLATLRKLQNAARDSKTMSAEEKRKRINEMGALITDLAQKAIEIKLKNP